MGNGNGKKHHKSSHDRVGAMSDRELDERERRMNPGKFDAGGLSLRPFKLRNARQSRAWSLLSAKPANILMGPAGTAKTWLAARKALEEFRTGTKDRIIIARAIVGGEDDVGFLPGDLVSKVEYHMKPVYENLAWHLGGMDPVRDLLSLGLLEVSNMALLRGRTFDNCAIILDEFQNNTSKQLKTALTRIGTNTTVTMCGDAGQIDLPAEREHESCVYDLARFKDMASIGYTKFRVEDVERSPLCREFVEAYEEKD